MKTEREFLEMVEEECDVVGKMYTEDIQSEAVCWYEGFDNMSDNQMRLTAKDLAEDWGEA